MRECVFKLCLAVLVSLLVVGGIPFVRAEPSTAAETSVAKYGAGANPTGNPIGGGEGYTKIVNPGSASFYVTSKTELLSALSKATSGQVIYVADSTQIDLTGYKNIVVPAGVTLASGRGRNGSLGGLIYTNERKPGYGGVYNKFFKTGSGVRITGIRLRGPDSEIGSSTYQYELYSGIVSSQSGVIEVDNCEIYNWSEAGVMVYLTPNGYVHHNYIHHCRRSGLGYGVSVAGGTAVIEANLFDYNRHSIMGTRGYPVSNYEARYNYVLEHANGTPFDVHGGNDVSSSSVPAGGTITIHHNTFKETGHTPVNIRGVPSNGAKAYANWVQYGSESIVKQIFYQALNNLGLKPYVKMSVYDNWYGTTSPPAATSTTTSTGTTTPTEPAPPTSTNVSNSAPSTPAVPSGTVNGWTGSLCKYWAMTTDPERDTLRYTFDWGDGSSSTSILLNSGITASATHAWAKAGNYYVRVKATDSKGAVSAWSPALTVRISSSATAWVASAPAVAPDATPVEPALADAGSAEAVRPSSASETLDGSTGSWYKYWAMPDDPDAGILQCKFNFDGEDGRSTTSVLLNSGVAGTVNPRARSIDTSNDEMVSGGDVMAASVRSGGMPGWAWVIIIVAVVLVARRAGVLVLGRLAQD